MKIGIDIGGSHIATGIVKEDGTILGKETLDNKVTLLEKEEERHKYILDMIYKEIDELLKKYDYDIEDISKIGIATPGTPTETSIENAVNMGITKFEIAPILEKKYNVKIKIKNDGKCAGLAEKQYGELKKYDDCIFLCIGTGVGSAVFIDGDLIELRQAPGFEFGHMMIDKNGIKCNCGNIGCFETYASMKRLKKEAIKQFGLDEDINSEELQKYIRNSINEDKMKNFIDNYIKNLSIGIINIINMFEPQAICFGGSFSYYADIFLPRLDKEIKENKFNKKIECKLICAKHKNDAGIIGATLL